MLPRLSFKPEISISIRCELSLFLPVCCCFENEKLKQKRHFCNANKLSFSSILLNYTPLEEQGYEYTCRQLRIKHHFHFLNHKFFFLLLNMKTNKQAWMIALLLVESTSVISLLKNEAALYDWSASCKLTGSKTLKMCCWKLRGLCLCVVRQWLAAMCMLPTCTPIYPAHLYATSSTQ